MRFEEINIFLSSTFDNEMIKNRDRFRNEINAKLNALAGQANVLVFFKDFELGIPEGTKPLDVIEVCLDAISYSNYFIGLIGKGNGTLVKKFLDVNNISQSKYFKVINYAINNNMTVLELEFYFALTNNISSYFFFDSQSSNYHLVEWLLKHDQNIKGFSNTEELIDDFLKSLEQILFICMVMYLGNQFKKEIPTYWLQINFDIISLMKMPLRVSMNT